MGGLPTDVHGNQSQPTGRKGERLATAADRKADRLCNLAPPTRPCEEEAQRNISRIFKTTAIKGGSKALRWLPPDGAKHF